MVAAPLGARVRANWRGGGVWYAATVRGALATAAADGRAARPHVHYDLEYEDGEREAAVPAKHVVPLSDVSAYVEAAGDVRGAGAIALAVDVLTVFSNCRAYSAEGAAVVRMAETLAEMFASAVEARAGPHLSARERGALRTARARFAAYEARMRKWWKNAAASGAPIPEVPARALRAARTFLLSDAVARLSQPPAIWIPPINRAWRPTTKPPPTASDEAASSSASDGDAARAPDPKRADAANAPTKKRAASDSALGQPPAKRTEPTVAKPVEPTVASAPASGASRGRGAHFGARGRGRGATGPRKPGMMPHPARGSKRPHVARGGASM